MRLAGNDRTILFGGIVKRLIISILLIIIASSFAGYFGLVSRKIPDQSIGVIFTKTSGFKSRPVFPGKLYWLPEALLPTNVKIFILPDTTFSKDITISGELQHGSTYSEYLEQETDFSWKVALHLKYKIRPEALPGLLQDEGLREETYASYADSVYKEIAGALTTSYSQLFLNDHFSGGDMFRAEQFKNITSDIFTKDFDQLQLVDTTVTEFNIPDIDLYTRTKEHYMAILSVQADKLFSDITITAEEKSNQTIKIELLKRYGELFSEYPILIDFLGLDTPNVNKLLPMNWE